MRILSVLVVVSGLFATVFSLTAGADHSMVDAGIWLQPLAYTLCYVLFIAPALRVRRFTVTVAGFAVVASIKMIVVPFLFAMAGDPVEFLDLDISPNSIQLANALAIYEVLIASAFLSLLIFSGGRGRKGVDGGFSVDRPFLRGSRLVYVLYFIVAVVVTVYLSRSVELFQLGVIDVAEDERLGDITDTGLVLARQVIRVAMLFLFVFCVDSWAKRYRESGKHRYVLLSLVLGMFNVALIVGERRAEQVYSAFVVTAVLYFVYRELRRWIVVLMGLAAVVVVGLMTVYKHLYAFLYGSYLEAIARADVSASSLLATLQAYFYGPGNLAASIEFAGHAASSEYSWLFDLARSTFGLSFLVRGSGTLTSAGFNAFVYGYERPTGQLVSSVGYGYIFFGALAAPVVICFNIFLATRLEQWFMASRHLEVKVVAGYVLARFAFGLFMPTPPLVSAGSIMLATGGLLYGVAKLAQPAADVSSGRSRSGHRSSSGRRLAGARRRGSVALPADAQPSPLLVASLRPEDKRDNAMAGVPDEVFLR